MEIIQSIDIINGKRRITFESGWQVWLKKDLALPFPPVKETSVNHVDFEQFILLHQYPSALDKAVSMLAVRARSKKEIEEKLRIAHFDPEVISLVIYKLEKENLLNDAEFSKQWVQSRMKKYGPARISRELQMKGLDRDTAASALDICREEDQLSSAVALAEKKLRASDRETDQRILFRRVVEMLIRRGFSWETAKKAFEKAAEDGKS